MLQEAGKRIRPAPQQDCNRVAIDYLTTSAVRTGPLSLPQLAANWIATGRALFQDFKSKRIQLPLPDCHLQCG